MKFLWIFVCIFILGCASSQRDVDPDPFLKEYPDYPEGIDTCVNESILLKYTFTDPDYKEKHTFDYTDSYPLNNYFFSDRYRCRIKDIKNKEEYDIKCLHVYSKPRNFETKSVWRIRYSLDSQIFYRYTLEYPDIEEKRVDFEDMFIGSMHLTTPVEVTFILAKIEPESEETIRAFYKKVEDQNQRIKEWFEKLSPKFKEKCNYQASKDLDEVG